MSKNPKEQTTKETMFAIFRPAERIGPLELEVSFMQEESCWYSLISFFNHAGEPEISSIFSDKHEKDVNSFNLVESESVNLICEVILRPEFKDDVIKFRWFRSTDGVYDEIEGLNNATETRLDARKYIYQRSVLELQNVNYEDRASYKCEAMNGLAAASTSVNVRIKSKLAALWPFLGVIGQVVTICTVICVYERRRNKPESEDSDANDGKSATSSSKR